MTDKRPRHKYNPGSVPQDAYCYALVRGKTGLERCGLPQGRHKHARGAAMPHGLDDLADMQIRGGR